MTSLLPLSQFPKIAEYLRSERHLSDAAITDANIQVWLDEYQKEWIAFPLPLGTKVRAAPGNDSPAKGKYLEEGTKAQLYYGDTLNDDMKRVFICEGEIDCLLLNQLGFYAVSSTSGAGTFYESWVMQLPRNCDVVLCFDKDEAGDQGREKVRSQLTSLRKDIRIFDVFWTQKGKGYDVSDFVSDMKKKDLSDEEIAKVLEKGIKVWRQGVEGGKDYVRPIVEVARPAEDVSYDEWMGMILEEFPQLASASEACAAVIAQLLIRDTTNCFGLILVDVPSSGKTICLNFFAGLEEIIYTSDDFSPASLVSHSAQKKGKDLSKVDMLPKIRFKTLMVREMATVFGDKDDDLRKKLHLLTRVMDGEGLETESGVHGKRGYQGDYLFMLLGASTPISLRIWKVMGGAGHRLFFLSLNSSRIGVDELHKILKDGGYKSREISVREKTHDFLRTLWRKFPEGIVWDRSQDELEATQWIAKLSHFVAHYRGEILVYSAWSEGEGGGKELQHTRPQIEQPTRVMTLLYGLARGRAALEGRNYIRLSDLGPVVRIALDTAPDPRPLVLKEIMRPDSEAADPEDPRRKVDAKAIAQSMKCSVNTAKKEMEKLIVLGIAKNVKGFEGALNPVLVELEDDPHDTDGVFNAVKQNAKKEMSLSDEYAWLAGKEFRALADSLGIDLPS